MSTEPSCPLSVLSDGCCRPESLSVGRDGPNRVRWPVSKSGPCPLSQYFLRTSVSRLTLDVTKNGLVNTGLKSGNLARLKIQKHIYYLHSDCNSHLIGYTQDIYVYFAYNSSFLIGGHLVNAGRTPTYTGSGPLRGGGGGGGSVT